MPSHRREGEWGNGAIVAVIAAMVIVMAVIAFTLHRNSPLVAGAPTVTTSEPSTSGQGGIAPVRGRSGIER
jgi:sugar phosphate permease